MDTAQTSSRTVRERPGLILPFVLLGAGLYLVLCGTEYLLLGLVGTPDTAIVNSATENTSRRGGTSYTAYYEFTTSDGAQYSGSESGFARRPGSVRIRYLSKYPAINRAEATTAATILMTSLYLLPGLFGIGFGAVRLFRRLFFPHSPTDAAPTASPWLGRAGTLACIVGALLLGFLGYAMDRQELFLGRPADEGAPDKPAGPLGNSAGNLAQNGYVALDGENVYFTAFSYAPIYRASQDGAGLTLVHDGLAQNLNVAGDLVYFLQFDASEGVRAYSIPKAGGKAKRLMSDSLSGLWVVGEWLYFTPEHGPHKLHRARLSGRGAQKLHDDVARGVVFTPEWVYYCNEAQGNRIFRMRHNGAERKQLGQNRAADLLQAKDWLFYRNEDDGDRLYRMSADGTNGTRFLNVTAHCLNSDGTWLYYCDFGDDARLYRVPLEGGTPERLTEKSVLMPHVAGDWIYVGVGDLATGLVPHRLRRDDGTGRAGPLQVWLAER
jgi:hypothetical protein